MVIDKVEVLDSVSKMMLQPLLHYALFVLEHGNHREVVLWGRGRDHREVVLWGRGRVKGRVGWGRERGRIG